MIPERVRYWIAGRVESGVTDAAAVASPVSKQYTGPKPDYWRSSGYRRITQQGQELFDLVTTLSAKKSAIETAILTSSPFVRCFRLIQNSYLIFAVSVFLGVLIYLGSHKNVNIVVFLFSLVFLYRILAAGGSYLESKYDRLRELILAKENWRFQAVERELQDADFWFKGMERRILGEWNDYCESYDGSPPDWDERRSTVISRDNHHCTQCGWPTDQKLLRRNLHVHHVTARSNGGNHSIDNLVTLCHVCHRKQEGHGHQLIRYQKRSGSRQ